MIFKESLEALHHLNRDHVHVFIAGPGNGEAIAVALPGSGWLLVDGCTTGADSRGLPLETIVTRWRSSGGEPILSMILTHPHEDHVGGFAELIDAFEPHTIALAGARASGAHLDIWNELRTQRASGMDRIRTGSTLGAFIAIDRWEESHPGKLLMLHDGVELPVAPSPARVIARAPDKESLDAHEVLNCLVGRRLENANHFSIVLEITYGNARIVLTGDLPRYVPGTTTSVPTGWDQVMAKHDHLGTHAALKIPHHGSADAMHPRLMRPAVADSRAWSVTPYNRSKLPRVADMDGLPQLLQWQPSILLTALPVSKVMQAPAPAPGIVYRSQLESRIKLQPTGERFLDAAGVEVTPSNAAEPLDPVWCIAVAKDANIAGCWRGRAALEVLPDAITSIT